MLSHTGLRTEAGVADLCETGVNRALEQDGVSNGIGFAVTSLCTPPLL
jgi:hypothetical protein